MAQQPQHNVPLHSSHQIMAAHTAMAATAISHSFQLSDIWIPFRLRPHRDGQGDHPADQGPAGEQVDNEHHCTVARLGQPGGHEVHKQKCDSKGHRFPWVGGLILVAGAVVRQVAEHTDERHDYSGQDGDDSQGGHVQQDGTGCGFHNVLSMMRPEGRGAGLGGVAACFGKVIAVLCPEWWVKIETSLLHKSPPQ